MGVAGAGTERAGQIAYLPHPHPLHPIRTHTAYTAAAKAGRLSSASRPHQDSPHGRLGDRPIQQHAEAAVEPEEAVRLHRLHRTVDDAVVHLGAAGTTCRLLVELQLRLDVLGGEGDADLDAARDAAWWAGAGERGRGSVSRAGGMWYPQGVCFSA